MKKAIATLLACLFAAGTLAGCGEQAQSPTDAPTQPEVTAAPTEPSTTPPVSQGGTLLVLSDEEITVNGIPAGTDSGADVFLSHDIVYYEDRDSYASGNPYGEGEASERHSAEDAAAHTVVNITAPGTYRIQGKLSQGQIRVDLGEDAVLNPEAVVNLVLDGADITCTVAPAILFRNVYECDNQWTVEEASADVDTSAAGANLLLAQGSVNTVNGSHVAKIYKDADGEKKLWKQDGAIYSYMSLNVDGEGDGSGILNLTADNEGLDTELHLTMNGGNVNIRSQDDGINTNEDGVSVTAINGGSLHIIAGLGSEGDGIDSNGFLVINGGTVVSCANPASDAGLDSDMGSYINGGTVVALGSTMDWPESSSRQVTMNLQFAARQNADSAIVVTREDGTFLFAYDPSADEILSGSQRQYLGAVISCPAFAEGDVCQVYVGGTVSGTEVGGVYTTVTDYTGGVRQAYTGTDVGMGGPGGFGGGHGNGRPGEAPPELPADGEMPEPPANGDRPDPPDGGEMPEPPAGGETPEPPRRR